MARVCSWLFLKQFDVTRLCYMCVACAFTACCLLQDVQVADWVSHGLGLAQYADAFRANAITVSLLAEL